MEYLVFAIFLAACFAAGTTGAAFPPGPWYESLKKPGWTPPNWLFPIAWTVLYVLIAWAATRVAFVPGNGVALAFFALQFSLNTLWTPIFFGLRRLGQGMAVLVALWVAVVGMLVSTVLLDRTAALMLVPYLVWVSYAGALNFWIWRNNRGDTPVSA
ncbi:MAG: TspO/MBR family protein [Rhodobacter sp.]|nr:TspO/MBR family protein [Rhodobacter sp.]